MIKIQPTISLFLFMAAVLAVVALWAVNWQPVHVQFLGSTATMPANMLMLLCAALGSLAVLSLIIALRSSSPAGEVKRLDAWKTQDAKLIAQIKSDREKQLEAKIATLEAALKTSLKSR